MKTQINRRKFHTMKARTIPMTFLFAATIQGISPQAMNAQSARQNQMPLEITVKKVSITNEDIDQAAKFCLIKEGSLEKGSTTNARPTPAQTVIMAKMCQ